MKQFLTIVFILLIAGAGAYYYLELEKTKDRESQTVESEPLQLPEDTTPAIQHPITESPEDSTEMPTETEIEEPLPALEESDNKIKEILSEILGSKISGTDLVKQFFRQTGIIHRFVVTIDSIPKQEIPLRYRLLPPNSGEFLVLKDANDKIMLDPENFKRYDNYIQLLNKIDTALFVKWYKRFYPLIQEDYDLLGYKDRYFNDRFIFAIDHLLETPEVIGTIELVQPKVFYNYADPALQQLSAGQKTLLRTGPANTAIVKSKLIEIRKALAAPQSNE